MTLRRNVKRQHLLLLEDVDDLGRSGDLVRVKAGFARNCLLPKQQAVVADPYTLRMQARLQGERAQQALVDKKDAELLADKIKEMTFAIEVKVDPDGHMYGSVSVLDIIRLMQEQGIAIERRHVLLSHPIKNLGPHEISFKLKEGVMTSCTLKVERELTVESPESKTP